MPKRGFLMLPRIALAGSVRVLPRITGAASNRRCASAMNSETELDGTAADNPPV